MRKSLSCSASVVPTCFVFKAVGDSPEARALGVLPDLSASDDEPLRATGTDDSVSADCLARNETQHASECDSVRLKRGAQAPKKNRVPGRGNAENRGLEAVGMGFEPMNGTSPLPVFKTGAFNRSATPPGFLTS